MTVLKLTAVLGLTEGGIKKSAIIYLAEQRDTITQGNTRTLAGYK